MNIPLGTGDFPAIVSLLQDKESFLILLHVNPDGDSIGSSIALGLALRAHRKQVTMVKVDELPDPYRFLAGADLFVPHTVVSGRYDAALLLDCGDLQRTGPAASLVALADAKVNIDHHITNAHYGDLNYIDPRAAAVGEQVYQLLHAAGWEIDTDIATALYTAIITDTGGFRYENTTPDSHLIAAHLLTFGVQPHLVSREVYDSRSEAAVRLIAASLQTLRVEAGGKVAAVLATREMYRQTGAGDEDAEGLVNYPRSIRGVEVALCFREVGPAQVRVNFRSKEQIDVSSLARRWGGGGHPRAAGCTVDKPLDEAVGEVMRAVAEAVAEEPPPV